MSQSTYSVLVVEDCKADQVLLQECFRECGEDCILVFAEDLSKAKRKLSKLQFHLILLDLNLGVEDGLDLVNFVRADASTAPIPIIALTGMGGKVSQAYSRGVNALLTKAHDFDNFSKKIRDLVTFWLHVAELPLQGAYERATNVQLSRISFLEEGCRNSDLIMSGVS